jgi:hypothetical protein
LITDITSSGVGFTALAQQSTFTNNSLSLVRHDLQKLESGVVSRLDDILSQLQTMPKKPEAAPNTATQGKTPILAPCGTSSQSNRETLDYMGKRVGDVELKEEQPSLWKTRRCDCSRIIRRQTKEYRTALWCFSWSDSEVSNHVRTCRFWSVHQETWSTTLSFLHVNVLIARSISLSLQISKQAGYIRITPDLVLRGVIRESSPAFVLCDIIRKFANSCGREDQVRAEALISRVASEMRKLLKNGIVSPYDVNTLGETLLHQATKYLLYFPASITALREFIYILLDGGVPINGADLCGRTALNTVWDTMVTCCDKHMARPKTFAEMLLNEGADLGDHDRFMTHHGKKQVEHLTAQLRIVQVLQSWGEPFQCGPLSLAILRRDEQEVTRILRDKPSSVKELNLCKQSPMHFASPWPRGIELLLCAGAVDLVYLADEYGWLPISYCIHSKDGSEASLELLINAGSPLSSPTWNRDWEEVLEICYGRSLDVVPAYIVRGLQDRRRKLYELAKSKLSAEIWAKLDLPDDRLLDARAAEVQNILVEMDIEIPNSITVPRMRGTVYHSLVLNTAYANQLWDAGFRDIDAYNALGFTPSMRLSYSGDADVACPIWLVDHGADPLRAYIHQSKDDACVKEAVASITALHFIGFSLGIYISVFALDMLNAHGKQKPNRQELLDISYKHSLRTFNLMMTKGSSDDCCCACSPSGCTPFTTQFKLALSWRRYVSVHQDLGRLRRWLFFRLTDLHSSNTRTKPMQLNIAEEIIRFETFKALQLTHTCCKLSGLGGKRLFSSEEVQEIRDIERDTLELHEDLVSEFCHKFQELGVTLLSFRRDYWKPRMKEVLKQHKSEEGESIDRLREMGVVLKEASKDKEAEFCEYESDISLDEDEANGDGRDPLVQSGDRVVSDEESEDEYASARSEDSGDE